MTGLEQLHARAAALRWAADLVDTCDPCDAAGFLRGVADATEAALKIVTPDYPDADEEPPTEAEEPEEVAEAPAPEAPEPDDTPASMRILPRAASEPPRRFSRWTDEQVEDLRKAVRTMPRAEAVRLIAERYGFTTQRVYDKLKDLGLRSVTRSVPLPNPAARQVAEDAAAATVADADIGTIRHWLATQGGMPVADHLTAELVAAQANERRIELGLPPFRLVKHPIGAPTMAELTRMHRAGEARDG